MTDHDEWWLLRAACKDHPRADWWFADKSDGHTGPRTKAERQGAANAKAICRACPVQLNCLRWILRIERGRPARERAGIFGGLEPEQRARMKGAA